MFHLSLTKFVNKTVVCACRLHLFPRRVSV